MPLVSAAAVTVVGWAIAWALDVHVAYVYFPMAMAACFHTQAMVTSLADAVTRLERSVAASKATSNSDLSDRQ